MYEYKATVTRVVDGDTFYAEVDLGFYVYTKISFRLSNIDTAEIFRPSNALEREHGFAAKAFLESLILNKQVLIKSYKTEKYGRWLADVVTVEGIDVVQAMLDGGFSKLPVY
jgi:micrococcal nuclease